MASAQPKERRQFTRIGFDSAATLHQGESTFDTKLVDISLNGVLLETPKNYEIQADAPVLVDINLSTESHIKMRASLAHSSSEVLGFKCNSMDTDSIAHLRRLIELNIDDPKASERVLSELLASVQ